ncbi:MAG TPA: putative quinol monooxygenase [Gemmatimonadales bacterium]|nr:putative quinol monooxygenase [Gemmatimonadales bacterium]
MSRPSRLAGPRAAIGIPLLALALGGGELHGQAPDPVGRHATAPVERAPTHLVLAMAQATPERDTTRRGATMYGLIGKITAVPGQRDALAAILLEGTREMPGCLSYVVAADPADPDALWVTEVWDSPESHRASLALPAVQAAIAKGRPLIAGFGNRVETRPLGGVGLRAPEPR